MTDTEYITGSNEKEDLSDSLIYLVFAHLFVKVPQPKRQRSYLLRTSSKAATF